MLLTTFKRISIVPIASKVFEMIIKYRVVNYWEVGHIFSHDQFGFISKGAVEISWYGCRGIWATMCNVNILLRKW